MARYLRFTFLVDSDERRILGALANRLQRSQSDTVRLLIRSASAGLTDPEQDAGRAVPTKEHTRVGAH